MRLSSLIPTFLCVTLACCTTGGANNSADGHGRGGASLSCFSVTSPAAAPTALSMADRSSGNAGSSSWIAGASCEAMCATEGATCTAAGGYVVPAVCTDVPPDFAACRCCAIAK